MPSMTFLDLCAGIGGFSLGLEMAGMTCIGQVEIDDYCTKILTKHWPHVPKWGDIKNLNPAELPDTELICGGYPCQPFSQAGKRRGAEDDRHLWPFIAAIVAAKRPAWCLFENVAGHITMGLDGVLSDLESLGYACQAVIIPACSVDAPHRRDRVWIVACNAAGQYEVPHQKLQGQQKNPNDRCEEPNITTLTSAPGQAYELSVEVDPNTDLQRRQEKHVAAIRAGSEQLDGPCQANPVPNAPINILGQHGESPKAAKVASCTYHIVKRTPGHAVGEPALEPGLGRGIDGLPPWLDGAWGDGIPKTTNHRLPNHAQRLKALGNAVVPPLVREIGLCIMAAHYGEAV